MAQVYTSVYARRRRRRSDLEHAAVGRLQRPRARRARDRRARAARAVRDGQDRRAASTRCCAGRSRSSKSCATRTARRPASRSSTSASASARPALRRRTGRARCRASARSAGRSSRSIRRPRRGWSPAASASRRSSRWPRRCAARGTPTTLFYGARRAARALLRRAVRARSASTSSSRPRTAAAAQRGCVTGAARRGARGPRPRDDVAPVRLRPDADDARGRGARRSRTARACDVSLEQVMGCGLGGCYSCVVLARDGTARRTSCARASTARCSTPAASSGTRWRTDMDPRSVGSHRLADAPQSAHRRERMLRLRRRVQRRRRPLDARRRRGQGTVPRRARRPPAAADRRNAGRACSTPSACRASAFTASSREKLPELRDRRAIVFVNICGTTIDEYVRARADPVGRTKVSRALELNISCPNIKAGGHHVRLQPDRHARRRQRRAQGDAAAGHPEADAERHRRRVVRASRRGGGRGRGLAREHVPGDGHRRRDPPPEADEHRRRAERPGDPADRRADGLRVPPGGEDSRSSAWAGSPTADDVLEFMIAGATAVQVGHRELRRPVHLDDAARRAYATTWPGTASRASPSSPAASTRRGRSTAWISS